MKKINFTKSRRWWRGVLPLLFLGLGSYQSQAQSYCSPVTGTSSTNNYITNVSLTSDLGSFSNSTGFNVFTDYSATYSVSAVQGTDITFTVNDYSGGSLSYCKIWVDWDQNGSFDDAGEEVYAHVTGAGLHTFTGTITVPYSATPGTTRLRVFTDWYNAVPSGYAAIASCATTSWGEAEDYGIEVTASVGCETVTFAEGVLSATPPCPSTSFTVTNTGSMMASGVSRVWQSRNPSGTGTWTTISGVGTTNLFVTGGIATATDYRSIVTCVASGVTDTTNELTVDLAAYTECYCTPSITYTGVSYITSVATTGGIANIGRTSTDFVTSTGYSNYTADTLSLVPGASIGFNVNTYTGNKANLAIWVDWNQNGVFESTEREYLHLTSTGAFAFSGSFSVPATASAGFRRMRVRSVYYSSSFYTVGDVLPCGNADYGETEDYTVKVIIPELCGVVDAGTISAVSTICPSVSFTITNSGGTVASGMPISWESSTDAGATWTTITGVSTPSYIVSAGITANTQFRSIYTCTGTGNTDTSNVLTVNTSPYTDCYCVPSATYAGTNHTTGVVTTGGISNISKTSGDAVTSTGYSNYTADTLTSIPGASIGFTVNTNPSGSNCNLAIWVDWNQNGVFETSEREFYSNTSSGAKLFTGSFTVPAAATGGLRRMRVRSVYYYSSYYTYTDVPACGVVDWGEAEDYTFKVVIPELCGVVDAGTISAVSSICPSVSFTISNTGGTVASGMPISWESSTDAGATWTTITGASTPSYIVSAGITVNTQFRSIYTCTGTGNADTSNVLTVNVSPFTDCYCTPSATYAGTNHTTGVVTTGGISNISKTSGDAVTSTGYSNYSSDTLSAVPSASIGFTVNTNPSGSNCNLAIWVDWNQNGVFETSEREFYSNTSSGAKLFTGSFTVPAAAAGGLRRMRVRSVYYYSSYYTYTDVPACGVVDWGEAEDYTFKVIIPELCGVVDAGTISAVSSICPSVSFTISNTGGTVASGMPITWESSTDFGTTWTTITGASTPSYIVASGITANTQFRSIYTCTGTGNADTSNVLTVNVSPFTDCYCIPEATYTGYNVTNMTTTMGVTNFSNSSGDYITSPGYSDYSSSYSVSQIQGEDVSFSATSAYSSENLSVWVDWNQNGLFEDSEEVYSYLTSSGTGSFSGTFTVPLTAVAGTTKMRVRSAYYYYSYYDDDGVFPCSTIYYGEAEDYTFTVISSCSPMAAVTAGVGGPACAGGDISLIATTDLTGSTFSWTGPGGFTSTDQNPTITGATVAMSGVYMMTATEPTNGCEMSASITVTVNPVPNAFTISPATSMICPGSSVALTASDGSTYGGSSYGFEASPYGFTLSGTGFTANTTTALQSEGTTSMNFTWPSSFSSASTGYYSSSSDLDLSALTTATLTFDHISTLDNGYGYGYVQYSSNGGTTWSNFPLSSYLGSGPSIQFTQSNYSDWGYTATNTMWKAEGFTIPTAALTSQFRIRFALNAPTYAYANSGWYIDNVTIGNPTAVTYSWTPLTGVASGEYSEVYTASPTPATAAAATTTYTAVATNEFGCTATNTAAVTVAPIPTGSSATAVSTCGGTDGQLVLFGLTASTGYTVTYTKLSDGITTTTPTITSTAGGLVFVTGLSPDTYNGIVVTLVSTGCTSSVTYSKVVGSPTPPSLSVVSYVDPATCGSNSGSMTLGSMVASATYTLNYTLDGIAQTPITGVVASGTGTYEWTGLLPGAYTDITVTNAASCASSAVSQTLSAPLAPVITVTSVMDPSNCTATDGVINFSGLNAGEDYTIDYILDGAVSATFGTADGSGEFAMTGLSSGVYASIVVTNSVSCAGADTSITLVQPVQDALAVTPTSAGGCSDVIHTLTASGGSVGATTAAITWSPMAGLFTDAAATTAYAGEDLAVVYANPAVETIYTVTAIATGCTTTTTATISIATGDNSAALATVATNGIDLDVACEQSGWTYYSDPSDPSNAFLFGIDWGTGNDAAKAVAVPQIQLDAADLSVEDAGSQKGTYTMKRYWNVDLGGVPLVNPVSVRFFYDASEKTDLDAMAAAFATMVGGTVETPTWFKMEGVAFDPTSTVVTSAEIEGAIALVDVSGGATLNGIPYAQFDGVMSFSGGTYAAGVGVGAPLNSKLGNIEAMYQGLSNKVIWNTLSEELGDMFQLEKSIDGRTFNVLTKVDAQGTPSQYFYLDNQPVNGYNYYRVLMQNRNGTQEISKIVYVRIDKDINNTLTVFPNPTDMDVTLRINGRVGNNAKIYITDLTGKVLETINKVSSNEININLDRYAQGVYLIKYSDDDFTHTVKVTKQ